MNRQQDTINRLDKAKQSVRTGGKGSVRRKIKKQRKVPTTDDKKLQSTLKRIGVNTIPQIDEVTFFKDDGSVRIFKNPKVQAAVNSNTFVVTGQSEVKQLKDILPHLAKGLETAQGGGKDDDEVPDLTGINFEEIAKEQK
eukprot:TRINITY_DN238_c0_g1_i4.p1 TRINITY_DN238_c0_g1~~TRINITY_DN238_c0_g1_i4.p1  ORF type:complete len:140 (+),score=51.30 TRINITY_DN238_c0_g1_i4:128-547(+)